jgi:signal peptidase I
MFRTLKYLFWETVEVVLIALAIILPIRYFLMQPFFVRGQSMEPNYHDGDYLIVDEVSYRFREPERGEVVVFRFPANPRDYYIKRVIGLPGETIEIKAGRVKIYNALHPDGFILQESYLRPSLLTDGDIYLKLGDDDYFVLGDNRIASYDSRRWGTLKRKDIIGRVWLRLWPLGQPILFEAPQYRYAP